MDDVGSFETISSSSPPLRSVHTANFAQLLSQLSSSLLVTTYQAGKLVVLRDDGGVLNTHFRSFSRPMGLAASPGRLAIGTAVDIAEFLNVPEVCPRLDRQSAAEQNGEAGTSSEAAPTGDTPSTADEHAPPQPPPRHDACYLPRRSHNTGDIQIHEMAWIGDELWFVNTAFSCLAVRSDAYSFEPRWRPSFIEQLVPADACHLNGLAVRDGQPAYVTALGETSGPRGWRENKRDGGVLINVESNEIIARGLSMPHSPRWHRNQLWLLESGDGSIGRVDLASGKYEAIARLPGFTRGLAFYGPLAFVGLSQVRESAVFSGIPLVDRADERACGVWVLDIETGQTVAFVRFEDAVQEIFAVELLPGVRYPEIVNHDLDLISHSYVLSSAALSLVPDELRSAATPATTGN